MDPLLSYGVAALTEIELRFPVLLVDPGDKTAPTSTGLTSVGIGGMRELTTEASLVLGIAVSGELLLPVGSLAPPNASYGIKGLVTKTLPVFRLSVNGSYGTYRVVPASAVSPTCRLLPLARRGATNDREVEIHSMCDNSSWPPPRKHANAKAWHHFTLENGAIIQRPCLQNPCTLRLD